MKYLLQNFWLKVIALLMGFLVWLHVATEKTYNYEISLPVTEIGLKDSLALLEAPPESLLVDVSASGKQLLRKRWRERGVRINAASYRTGRHAMMLNVSNVSLIGPTSDISLDDILFPRQIQLAIDRLAEVELPVTPDIETEADEGYAVNEITIKAPRKVTLTGPRSALRRVRSLKTKHKRLAALRNTITIRQPVELPEGYGFAVHPDSVTVEIDVVPVKTRVYSDVPVVVFNAPVGKTVRIDPATVDIELTGPPRDIDLLNRNALTASVDYRRISQAGYMAIKIDCPSKFTVKRSSADSAHIDVE